MSRKKKVKNYKKEKKTLYFYDIPLTIENILFALYIISIIIVGLIVYYKILSEGPDTLMLLALSYLGFCAYAYHEHKLNEIRDMHKKVAWIYDSRCYDDHRIHLRNGKLEHYIEIYQRELKISQQYRIDFSSETEKEHLSQILNKHKEQVIRNYFYDGNPKSEKNIYDLKSLEYYFFSLSCFVFDNLSNFKDGEVYGKKERISDWKFKRQLTEYGRVYYKLDLITQTYIENNKQVQSLFKYIDKERKKHIIEALEKNEDIFLSYRP